MGGGGGGGSLRIGGLSINRGSNGGSSAMQPLSSLRRVTNNSNQTGGNQSGNGKAIGKLILRIAAGPAHAGAHHSRHYCPPVIVVPGPEVLFKPAPMPAAEIVVGGVVELPGDWGREPGYACLMVGEEYAYFKVLEWTPKGVKLEVPNLELKGPLDACLRMVRFDRYAFPPIPVKVIPMPAEGSSAVAGGGAQENTAGTQGNTAGGQVASGQTSTAEAKTGQSSQTTQSAEKATQAADNSDVPPDLNDGGTFGQVEKDQAGDGTAEKAK